MTYKVVIEEIVSQEFEVDAADLEEARDRVIENYKNGNMVLEPGELQSAGFYIYDEDGEELLSEEQIY